MSRSKNGISDPFTSNIIPLPGEFCEHRRPGYQPELGGWVFFLNGVTVFTRDTKQIPVDQWLMLESLGLCCRLTPLTDTKPCGGVSVESIRAHRKSAV